MKGLKCDQDKPRYDLLPPKAIDELAKVLTFGAKKYSRFGIVWENQTHAMMESICHARNAVKIIKFTSNQLENVSLAHLKDGIKQKESASIATQEEALESGRQESVGLAMKVDFLTQILNTERGREKDTLNGREGIRIKSQSTKRKDESVLMPLLEIERLNGIDCLENTGLPKAIMIVSLLMDAKSAEELMESRILTTATKRDCSEVCFAVGATTDSECLEIIYRELCELSVTCKTLKKEKIDGANSWKNIEDGLNRYRAALLRHTFAIQRGELVDSESGLPHSAHVMCCAAFIVELEKLSDKPTAKSLV